MKKQAVALEAFIPTAESIEPKVFKFTFADLSEDKRNSIVISQVPKKGKWIYSLTTDQPETIAEIFGKMSKEDKKEWKLPRYNGFSGNNSLYVGSSNSLRKRIEEHCGFGYKGTFSLKLNRFVCADNIAFELKCFEIETDNQTILQNIEDGLWRELKPMFGKPGSNNRLKRTSLTSN